MGPEKLFTNWTVPLFDFAAHKVSVIVQRLVPFELLTAFTDVFRGEQFRNRLKNCKGVFGTSQSLLQRVNVSRYNRTHSDWKYTYNKPDFFFWLLEIENTKRTQDRLPRNPKNKNPKFFKMAV